MMREYLETIRHYIVLAQQLNPEQCAELRNAFEALERHIQTAHERIDELIVTY